MDSITKRELADIAYTKKFFEEHYTDKNGKCMMADYIENLFQVLYVEKRRVTGLNQRDKAKIVMTANFIKDQTKAAAENYKTLQTQETKELAEKWEACYKHYTKYFVEKALNQEPKTTENEATM